MIIALSIIFIAIGIEFMYVGIRICRNLWHAHVGSLVFVIGLFVFVIGLCFVCMAIEQLMYV